MFKNMDKAIKICKENVKELNLNNIKRTLNGVRKLDSENKYKFLIMVLLVIILFAGLYIKSYVLDIIMIIIMSIGYIYMKRKKKR